MGDLCSVPFNIACGRCRMCKEGHTGVCLNTNPDRPGRRLRLRGHGWVGRRPGRVRDGSLRRLEPAAVPRPGPGHGEDPRPDDALGHLPHRLPRLRDGRGGDRLDRLCRRGRPGRPGRGPLGPIAGGRGGDRRRPGARTPGPRPLVRLRDHRRLAGRAQGPDRRAPRRAGGRLCRRRRRLRGPRPRRRCRARGAGHGVELAHGRHPCRGASGHSRPLRDRGSRAGSTTRPSTAHSRCR